MDMEETRTYIRQEEERKGCIGESRVLRFDEFWRRERERGRDSKKGFYLKRLKGEVWCHY